MMQNVDIFSDISSLEASGTQDTQEVLVYQVQKLTKSVNDVKNEVKNLKSIVKKQENVIDQLKQIIVALKNNEDIPLSIINESVITSSENDVSSSESSFLDEISSNDLYQSKIEEQSINEKKAISNIESSSDSQTLQLKGGEYINHAHLTNEMDASSLIEMNPGKAWPKILNVEPERLCNKHADLDESFKNWLICPQQLIFDRLIGRGSSSLVYQGRYKDDIVAIKVLNFNPLDCQSQEKQKKELSEEVNVMKSVKSKYVVNLHGIVLEPAICIVMEYCEKGSLYDILRKTDRFGWSNLLRIFKEIVCGVAILHKMRPPIVHRDLKSLNILITKDMRVKVADFGLSRLTETKEHFSTLYKLRGTHTYCAPEVYIGEQYTDKSDIYSLGIILWELVYRCTKKEYQRPFSEYPWINYSFQVIIQTAKNGLRPTIPPCPEKIRKLICTLWDYNPSKRPDAFTLLQTVQGLEKEYHENRHEWLQACSKAKEYKDIQAPTTELQKKATDIIKNNDFRTQKPQNIYLFKWVASRKEKRRRVKKSLKFEDLLADEKLFKSFETFLKKELCDEYLRFWKQLKIFLESSDKSILVNATNIYTTFLLSEVVAIDPKQLKIISKKIDTNDIDKNIFEDVRYEVESILKTKFSYFATS